MRSLALRYVCSACKSRILGARKRQFASSASTAPDIYDVVAVGGGPVGLSLLAALKSSTKTKHLRTALIESQNLSKAQTWSLAADQYSNRASSLTPSSVDFLEAIGAWQHIDESRVQAYDEMQVYDASNNASIQFDWKAEAQRYNAPPRTVATMTENSNLTKALLSRVIELKAESSLLANTKVHSIEHGTDDPERLNLSSWPIISLDSTSIISPRIAARLLIGADGFNSPVRAFAGISSHGWDYQRHGVVATLTTDPSQAGNLDQLFSSNDESPNRATAYQRFVPSLGGPIALLPLPSSHASLVWSTTPQNATYLKSLNPTSFIAMVNAAFRLGQADLNYLFTLSPTQPKDPDQNAHDTELIWRLQHTTPPLPPSQMPPIITHLQPGTVASFPLRFRQAESFTAPRLALAGDAAHTIHPLAGQGLNLGLADARALAETIAYAVEHGQDLGDPMMTLDRYNAARFGKALKMGGGVDLIGGLYGLGSGDAGGGPMDAMAGTVRGWGMKVLGSGYASGLRGWIMRQAEG